MALQSLPHDNRVRAFSVVSIAVLALLMAFLLTALVHSSVAH
ncbi:MAG TPA: hypothetical protein VFF06_07915 [Polyangia bacterium]|nr:hypothetical protein [Polyangia bacterium]